ncbi:glycosyltransferase [Citrobacter cronae]|uniref:glycosyltransferase n=1 Tax=Citrobacter cronae TaxID=1748967 RepID=UPI001C0F3F04|nr:glycosyltransferase [Citrobacter cronae]MBU5385643.1 glycosyltransferase [Citrobacter cronae]
MLITIVIPVWQRAKQISLMLSKLDEQASCLCEKLEVILCDSHSSREIDDLAIDASQRLPSLIIRHLHTDNILAAKRNLGIKVSNGDYLVFLDDDCIPDDDFLKNVVALTSSLDKNKIYCGEVRFEEELVKNSNYYRYRDSRHPHYETMKNRELDAWTIVSMNCLLSKELLTRTGALYNEKFVGYGCEDHEFGWKLIKKDIKIELSKQLIYHHEYNGDILKYSNKIKSTARDGMYILANECPELILNNKKLCKLEKIFANKNFLGTVLSKTIFNIRLSTAVAKFLTKVDRIKFFYMPVLFRFVLICAYIEGIRERESIDRRKLLKEWYL